MTDEGRMNTNNTHQFLAHGGRILRRIVSVYFPLGKRHYRDQSGIDRICIKLNDCLYRVVRVKMHIPRTGEPVFVNEEYEAIGGNSHQRRIARREVRL